MSESEYKPCCFCGARWDGPAFPDPDHLPSCPSNTNLWPIRAQDLGDHGMVCPACDVPFAVGDLTVERLLSKTAEMSIVMAVCLDCGFWDRPIPNLPPSFR